MTETHEPHKRLLQLTGISVQAAIVGIAALATCLWLHMRVAGNQSAPVEAVVDAGEVAPTQWLAQKLTPLGDLPGGYFHSSASGVSADGSVIVGSSVSDEGSEAFRWTEDDGMQGLGDLPGGGFRSIAYGVSADGSVIVGVSDSDKGPEAFRWSKETGMQGLGDLPGGDFNSGAVGVSANGSVIVGRGSSNNGYGAFRWTEETGMEGLGYLSGSNMKSIGLGSGAIAVSRVGTVIVGYSASGTLQEEAFRWTKDGGMKPLGYLPGGNFWLPGTSRRSSAAGVSSDGSVIVGSSDSGNTIDQEAFRWTEEGGMEALGDLPGGRFSSSVSGVSADASVIVGSSDSGKSEDEFGSEAFRWTKESGMEGLADLPGGHFKSSATDISADGSVIIGTGRSHKGYEAFRWTKQ